jgi:hypothetical protein
MLSPAVAEGMYGLTDQAVFSMNFLVLHHEITAERKTLCAEISLCPGHSSRSPGKGRQSRLLESGSESANSAGSRERGAHID